MWVQTACKWGWEQVQREETWTEEQGDRKMVSTGFSSLGLTAPHKAEQKHWVLWSPLLAVALHSSPCATPEGDAEVLGSSPPLPETSGSLHLAAEGLGFFLLSPLVLRNHLVSCRAAPHFCFSYLRVVPQGCISGFIYLHLAFSWLSILNLPNLSI